MMGTFLFYLGALLGIMAMVVPLVYGVRPPADAIAASYGAALFWMVFGLGLHFLHIRKRK